MKKGILIGKGIFMALAIITLSLLVHAIILRTIDLAVLIF